MAIPNPQSKIVDNTGKQNITLGELLQVQMDVEKWSQNTDVNTLRGQIESEKGFRKLRESLGEEGAIAQSVNNLTKNVKKPEAGAGIEGPVGELDDVFSRVFRVVIKNIEGFSENLNGVPFKEIGKGFLSTTRAAERVNSGFKELTNGIGQFGPMINTAKTFVFKLVAGFNVLLGVTQLISSAFVKFFSFLGNITGITDKAKNFFGTIFAKDQGGTAARNKFIDSDQAVKDARKDRDDVLAEGPGQIKVQFIEGTPDYYKDMATAFHAGQIGGEPMGVGAGANKAQNKLNEEFIAKANAANQKVTDAEIAAGEKFDNKQNKFKKKEELKQRAFEKKQLLKQKVFEKKQQIKQFAFQKAQQIKQFAFQKAQQMKLFLIQTLKIFGPLLLLIGGIALAVDIFKNKIKEFADTPLAGIFAGLKTGLTKAGEQARSMFSGLKNFLGKLFPKMFPKTATTKTNTKAKVDPKKTVGKVLKEGGDDVAKEASKTGAKEVTKQIGKQVVKKIPIIGAVAETTLDASSNEKKFAKIKAAYENQVPIMPDGNGDLRPMTEEEFLAAEQSMMANRAGSVGRGGGALAGATAGAAAGAAIGSVIPIVGTAIGGILGGVIGGFFGGRAGDKVATELANKAEGIDDPQAYIDMLANNVPELQNEAGEKLAAANGEVADATVDAQGGGGSTAIAQNVNNNTNNESVTIMNQSLEDKQLEYAVVVG